MAHEQLGNEADVIVCLCTLSSKLISKEVLPNAS